jgi:threonine dehydratase
MNPPTMSSVPEAIRSAFAAHRLTAEQIRAATRTIPQVLQHTPMLTAPALSRRLGCAISLKDESSGALGSFKGRGVEHFLETRDDDPDIDLVCASAGNFGLALAAACQRRGRTATVFVAQTASAYKVQRIRDCGVRIVIAGNDFDAAKDAARRFASDNHQRFVEDGAERAISAGAGTIALEMLDTDAGFDAILVPLGNGALLAGMGCWIRSRAPALRIIGVVAAGAPIMAECLRLGGVVAAASSHGVATIADGIAVRVPVPEAVEDLRGRVDEVLIVDDDALRHAMTWLLQDCGLKVEPSAAAGIAAIAAHRQQFSGQRVATVITGANIAPY